MIRDQTGAALLIVLVTTTLIAALAAAVILVADTETRIVSTAERSEEAREASAAGIDRALMVLAPALDWSAALGGPLAGPLDVDLRVTTPGGRAIDLDAARRDLQAETDAVAPADANRPVWRLFMSGTLASLAGFGPGETPAYVAVWVADDWRERDGDPQMDTNGIVILRAEAWGRESALRAVDATVAHGEPQSACPEPVLWTYDPGSSRGLAWHGYRTAFLGLAGPRAPRVRPVATQSGPPDPCRTQGPGAVIVTWREVR